MNTQGIKKLSAELKKHLLFILLPLMIGLLLFFGISLTTSSTLKKYGNLSVTNFQSDVSAALAQIELTARGLQNNSEFLDYLYASETTLSSKSALSQLINQYQSDCEYISDIYLFSESHDCIYTAGGYFSYQSASTFLGRIGIFLSEGSQSGGLNLPDGWYCNNEGVFSPYYSVSLNNDGAAADSILILVMDRSYLVRLMLKNDSLLCCIFNDDCSIYSIFALPYATDWTSPGQVASLLGQPVKCFYLTDEDYTYLVAIASSEYYAPLYLIVVFFSLYFVIVLFISIVQVYRQMNQRYRFVSPLLGIISPYSEEDYSEEDAHSVISEALQSFRDEKTSKALALKSRNLRLLLSDLSGTEKSKDQYERAGISANAEAYCVVTFHIQDLSMIHLLLPASGENVEETEDLDDLLLTLLRTTLELYADGRYSFSCTGRLHDLCAILSLSEKPRSCDEIISLINRVLLTVENSYGVHIVAGISEIVEDPKSLPAAFQNNYNLFHFSRILGSHASIITQEDFSSDMKLLLNDNYLQQISMLINALLSKKCDIVPQLIRTISDHTITNDVNNLDLTVSRLSGISNLLSEAVISSHLPAKEANRLLKALYHVSSMPELVSLALDFSRQMEAQASADKQDPVQVACAFIEQHYADPDLSVPQVCEAAGLSVQQLSRLFRQQLDITIMEYITTLRIDQAKKLLLETDLTATVIANRAGYNNLLTFSRNFKKNVGTTPGDFRASYR